MYRQNWSNGGWEWKKDHRGACNEDCSCNDFIKCHLCEEFIHRENALVGPNHEKICEDCYDEPRDGDQ